MNGAASRNGVSLHGAPAGSGSLDERDRILLRRAIELGRSGWGRVHPNPMVGAVIARDDQVLAEGCHQVFGGPHAEVVALSALSRIGKVEGATLYSSLEPCNHAGKTPPCTAAIRSAGIARVVYWAAEPGATEGGGSERLRRDGLRVEGPFGNRADWAAENPFFFRKPTTDRPYLALKLAMSLDGYIAPAGGRRVWLTGAEARAEVHRLRAGFDAVLVGSRTWQADDPRLDARGAVVPRRQPIPVLLDREGRTTPGLRALQRGAARGAGEGAGPRLPIVATSRSAAARTEQRLGGTVEVMAVRRGPGGLDLDEVLRSVARRGVQSVLCEGGGILAASLIAERLVDRIYLFIAPFFIGAGGVPAFPPMPVPGTGVPAREWESRLDPARFGNDTLIVLDRKR